MATEKEIVERIRAKQRTQKTKPINLKSKIKPVTSKIRNLASATKTKLKPVTSKIRNVTSSSKTKVSNIASNVKSKIGSSLTPKQRIKLRVGASKLNNLVIDKSRPKGAHWKGFLGKGPGKGFIKKTPVLGNLINAVLAHGDYKEEKKNLVALGYAPDRAAKMAFIKTGTNLVGYGAGTAVGTAVSSPTGPGAVVGAIGGGIAGGQLADRVITPLLIRSLGLKKSKEQLDKQLAQRQVLNNRLEHARIQAGGAN